MDHIWIVSKCYGFDYSVLSLTGYVKPQQKGKNSLHTVCRYFGQNRAYMDSAQNSVKQCYIEKNVICKNASVTENDY